MQDPSTKVVRSRKVFGVEVSYSGPSVRVKPPLDADGSHNLNAPYEQWIEVKRPRVNSPPIELIEEDPVLAEVQFYRMRRNHYHDGFLVERDETGHVKQRAKSARYALRDTRQRIERDLKLIRERREAKKRWTEEVVAAEILAERLAAENMQRSRTVEPQNEHPPQRQATPRRKRTAPEKPVKKSQPRPAPRKAGTEAPAKASKSEKAAPPSAGVRKSRARTRK